MHAYEQVPMCHGACLVIIRQFWERGVIQLKGKKVLGEPVGPFCHAYLLTPYFPSLGILHKMIPGLRNSDPVVPQRKAPSRGV